MPRNPNPCRACGETATCTPTGHHCPACGHHDDSACDRTWTEDDQDTGPAGTIVLPAALFDALLTAHRRRNAFRYAAARTHIDSPGLAALRELAAAYATGSTRLLPATAYRLAHAAAIIDEGTWWAVRDLLDPAVLADLDAADRAEQEAAWAEYRAEQAAAQRSAA